MSNRLNWDKAAKIKLVEKNGSLSIIDDKPVKIHCTIQRETAGAFLIDSGACECWLPKSVVEADKVGDGTAVILVPEWLAHKKGLI
jgi:hypothetical protein